MHTVKNILGGTGFQKDVKELHCKQNLQCLFRNVFPCTVMSITLFNNAETWLAQILYNSHIGCSYHLALH